MVVSIEYTWCRDLKPRLESHIWGAQKPNIAKRRAAGMEASERWPGVGGTAFLLWGIAWVQFPSEAIKTDSQI